MTISARSALMAGIATVTASAVLIAPSVEPLPPPKPAIQLAASSVSAQPLALPAQYSAQLAEWWQELFLPSADRPFPSPPTEPLPTPGSIPSSLEAAYHAIEPWVQYGFEIAQYAVGWIPYVGWLSGQIMIFYQLGEGIVHAIAHNTLDWLDGNGSFAQNLGEGIRWSIDTLIQFGINEWNYFLPPLPPFPPIPCIIFCANLAELNAPLDGVRVGLLETVTDLLTGLSASLPFPRDPEEPPVGLTTEDVPGFTAKSPDLVSEVSRVPETVINSLTPPAAAEDENAGTVPDLQPGPKKPRLDLTSLIEAPGNIIKAAVRPHGEVRGVAAETTGGESQPTARAHGPIRDAVANTATTVTKKLTDTARDVASTVKKATDDTRTSVKKATDNTHTSVKKTKSDDE
jgi:hypothetical protein